MKEVQKEAFLIESDMESKFKSMLLANEQKKRIIPSLTSEMEEAAAKQLQDDITKVPSYNQTRELIVQRLGGPFDYNQF